MLSANMDSGSSDQLPKDLTMSHMTAMDLVEKVGVLVIASPISRPQPRVRDVLYRILATCKGSQNSLSSLMRQLVRR